VAVPGITAEYVGGRDGGRTDRNADFYNSGDNLFMAKIINNVDSQRNVLLEVLNERKEWKKKDYKFLIKKIIEKMRRYFWEFNFR